MKELDSVDNNIEQTQETVEVPAALSRADLSEVHKAANQLLETLASVPDGDMVGEIVANALKLLRDRGIDATQADYWGGRRSWRPDCAPLCLGQYSGESGEN